jgi:integrase
MARAGKPRLRPDRGTWVSKIRGKLVTLGRTEPEAWAKFRELTGSTAPITFGEVASQYLAWVAGREQSGELSPDTAATYRWHTARCTEWAAGRPASSLRGFEVLAWLQSHPGWSASTRAGYGRQLRRVTRWAASVGLLDRDPLAGCPLPTVQRRERAATAEDVRAVLAAILCPRVRATMEFLWLTGARAGEACRLTAADVDLDAGQVVLKHHKTARKTGRPRIIPLCPAAVDILRPLMGEPGPLLRNHWRRAWQPRQLALHLRRASIRAGVPVVTPHMMRSLWATDAVSAGVPLPIVAGCLGHSVAVLSRHYDRSGERVAALTDAARKVRA